jgi:hypothetical protein
VRQYEPAPLLQEQGLLRSNWGAIQDQLRLNSGDGVRSIPRGRAGKCNNPTDALPSARRRGLGRKIDSSHAGLRDGNHDIIRPIHDRRVMY